MTHQLAKLTDTAEAIQKAKQTLLQAIQNAENADEHHHLHAASLDLLMAGLSVEAAIRENQRTESQLPPQCP